MTPPSPNNNPIQSGKKTRSPAPQPARPSGQAEQNPLLMVHRLLRGRYHWAVALGVLGALLGAAIGYQAITPVYRGSSILRVAPVLPRLIYETKQSSVMPMYGGYINSQIALMTGSRVVDLAMQDEDWQRIAQLDQTDFKENLEVQHPRGSQLISIAFTHPDPKVATQSVKAIVQAYETIRQEQEVQSEGTRLRKLDQRRSSLRNQLSSIRDQILQIADDFGSDALEEMYQAKLNKLQDTESRLRGAQAYLSSAQAMAAGEKEPRDFSQWSVAELAAVDGQLQSTMRQKRTLQSRIDDLGLTLGREHQTMVAARNKLEALDERVQARAETLRRGEETPIASETQQPSSSLYEVTDNTVERLRGNVQQYQQRYDEVRQETVTLGQKNLQIKRLKDEEHTLEQRLRETQQRLEALNVESAVGGRISTISEAETAPAPSNSSDRLQATIGGAGLGGGLGVGLILLLGFWNPRLRDSVDMPTASGPLLGLLPNLPRDLADPMQANIAANCVHHIRLLLQVRSQQASHTQVLAVTSPASGTGKTSLTLALGLSYASAGARTLLIDADLRGGGLTHRAQTIIRRKLGQVLHREGLVEEDQLQQALRVSEGSGRKLGEVLVELGILNKDDLERALALQEDAQMGVLDALEGEPIENCVASVGIPKLSILPSGAGDGAHAGPIAPAAFAGLLRQASGLFDVVLIDNGPVPGDIDASTVATQADGVITVVSRGDQRSMVNQSIERLRNIGARSAGIVFNRAESGDLARFSTSNSSAALDSRRHEPPPRHSPAPRDEAASRFGSLAHAVASATNRRQAASKQNGHADPAPPEPSSNGK